MHQFGAPLGVDLPHPHDIAREMRIALQEAGVVLPHGDHQGDVSQLSVVEQGRGGRQSGGGVQVEEARPAGCPRISLGHARADHLMQTEYVADIGSLFERVHELDLGRSRDPEDILDLLGPEQVDEGLLTGRHGHSEAKVLLTIFHSPSTSSSPK